MTDQKKPKRGNGFARTIQEDGSGKLPACAVADNPKAINTCHFVPVSFVAREWKVTPRRIRSLLAVERLEGRRGANGYWEVAYGTRGPALKRSQTPKRGRPKLALVAV